MPAYKTDLSGFWERLDHLPDKNEKQQAVNPVTDLPTWSAPEGLWDEVEEKLHNIPATRIKTVRLLWQAAAAVIILCIGSGIIIYRHKTATGRATALTEPKSHGIVAEDDSGMTFEVNRALREGNPQTFNSALFKALDQQLQDVNTEIRLMKPMIRNRDPQMMKYYYRLVNLKVEIEKKRMKIIMES